MFRWMLAASRKTAVVSLAIVEMMVNMPVEMFGAVKPWPCSNEDAACEPLWPVIAIWSAVVGRSFIVPVRTYRRFSDPNGNLCRCIASEGGQ
jgi:hypothetical protein